MFLNIKEVEIYNLKQKAGIVKIVFSADLFWFLRY